MRVRTDISLDRYRPAGVRGVPGLWHRRRKMPGPEADIESLGGDLERIAGDFSEAMRTLDDEIAARDTRS